MKASLQNVAKATQSSTLPPRHPMATTAGPAFALGNCPADGRFPSGSRNPNAGTFYSPPLTGDAPERINNSGSVQEHQFRKRLRTAAFWAGEVIGALCILALPLVLLFLGEIVR